MRKKWRKLNHGPEVISDTNSNMKVANNLFNSFDNKFLDSKTNKELYSEFLMKYEAHANKFRNERIDMIDFSIENIEKAAKELHLRKASDINELAFEHVIYAHPIIFSHLRNLCRLIVKHGHVPQNFQLGVIIPIIKDNKRDKNDIDNYRPVTIISMISKVFAMCMYRKIYYNLNVSGLQLSFVKGGGCDKSFFTVTKVVNHF